MLDMHTHILPGIDDGAKNIEESVKLLKMEIENGVKTVILTPHISYKYKINYSKSLLIDTYQKFLEDTKDLNIKILLGSEIYYSNGILDQVISNELPTINNTNYLLLEFNMMMENDDIDEVTYNFVASGYKPIIAHVERYQYMTLKKVKKIKETGGMIQINAGSLDGFYGSSCKKLAKKLLKEHLVDFIASDCHNLRRKPNINIMNKVFKKHKEIITDENFFG